METDTLVGIYFIGCMNGVGVGVGVEQAQFGESAHIGSRHTSL